MPVFVGALVYQPFDALLAGSGVARIAQLPRMGTETTAQVAFVLLHVWVRLAVGHRQRLQGSARASFGSHSSVGDRPLEILPQARWQRLCPHQYTPHRRLLFIGRLPATLCERRFHRLDSALFPIVSLNALTPTCSKWRVC